ncbi:hypothetical protein CR513_58742, partial [Mucuna pruriens]
MASDCSRLQNFSKREQEGFTEYAQRWRELAAQVQPPLTGKEMVTMFSDTLPFPFYDKAVGSVASSFIDLVMVSERIESGIKQGNFAQSSSSIVFAKKPSQEKKKGEANVVLLKLVLPYGQETRVAYSPHKPTTTSTRSYLLKCLPPYQPHMQQKTDLGTEANSDATRPVQQNFRNKMLASIPMTYTKLLPLML